jgi:hypothetical protein
MVLGTKTLKILEEPEKLQEHLGNHNAGFGKHYRGTAFSKTIQNVSLGL